MAPPSRTRAPNPTLRWALMLIGVAVVFGGVFAIKAFFAKQTNTFFDNMPQPAVTVSSHVVKTQRWSDGGEAVGTFVAVNGTDVTTEAGGVVRSIEFDAGQPVAAGAVLVRLNTANEEASLKALEASARLARVQADRWQQLGREQLVSRDDVQQRATGAATAQAQVDAQRALVAQKTIRAPFSGVLGIRKVNLGQYVAPGTPIVSLQQLDPIYLDFSLPEQQIGQVVEGTMIRASVDALPGVLFDGRRSMPTSDSPASRPLSAKADVMLPGLVDEKRTRKLSSVTPTKSAAEADTARSPRADRRRDRVMD